jgi:hypothetical protein
MERPRKVANAENAYIALKAALAAVQEFNRRSTPPIKRILIPRLCTGIGRQPATPVVRFFAGAWALCLHLFDCQCCLTLCDRLCRFALCSIVRRETFAPVAECALFWVANFFAFFGLGETLKAAGFL